MLRRAAAAIGCVVLSMAATAATTSVIDVATARGTIRVAHYRADLPLANLYVMSGGDGVLRLQPDGSGTGENFLFSPLVRNRQALLDAGYSVVMIDAPSDMLASPGIPFAHRATAAHSAELLEVLRAVQARDNLPAWLLGFSAGGPSVANVAIAAPSSTPFGLILLSPNTGVEPHLLTLNLEAIQRPVLLLTHALDSCAGTPPANAPRVMARLTGQGGRRHVSFTAGSAGTRGGGCDSTGYHGLGGSDALFLAELVDFMRHNAAFVQAPNYQGLWWRSPAGLENGWGVNLTQQGEILFGTWFTYDIDGSGMWIVMSAGRRTAEGVYSGELYRTTGPAFSLQPWAGAVTATPVGNATFTFTDSNNGTFAYTLNGVTQSKPIVKQQFDELPACIAGVPHAASPNYQALWWSSPANSEPGWGVNIAHQGNILFTTWFTYDSAGRGQWLVMSRGERTAPGIYSGELYRTRGPAYNLDPWVGNVTLIPAGRATFTFTDAEHGSFAFTLDGVSRTKLIERQVYGTPVSVCR